MELKFINSQTNATIKTFTDQLWNVNINDTIEQLQQENKCNVSCIESFTIYEVLNHGMHSAFEDQEIEITGFDETFDFSKAWEDQPSYSNITQSIRMFKAIESHLTLDEIKTVFMSVFSRPLSSYMVKYAFEKHINLIDPKMMLSLLNGYYCYDTKYFTNKYQRRPLKSQHDNFTLTHDYEVMLEWVYDNHQELLTQGLALRIEDLKKYDNYMAG